MQIKSDVSNLLASSLGDPLHPKVT